MSAVAESENYFGILNAAGDFWTTDVFRTKIEARNHIIKFWRGHKGMAEECFKTHRIVPVIIKLIYVEPPEAP